MRTSELDLLFLPDWKGASLECWQSRWARKLANAKWVEPRRWAHPAREAWVGEIAAACSRATRPVVLVAHGLGVAAAAHAGALLPPGRVKGAFFAGAPSDEWLHAKRHGEFASTAAAALPFPALLIASRNDPAAPYEFAQARAALWGARLVDAGEAGRLNAQSGHGPWPEGLLQFAAFLKQL